MVDDLHFTTSLFMYKILEERGLELRVVKHRDGAVPLEAIDAAIVSTAHGFSHGQSVSVVSTR